MWQRSIYNSILFSARSIYPKRSRTVGYHNSLHLRLQSFIERCLSLSTVIRCRAPSRCFTQNNRYIKSVRQRSLSKCVFVCIYIYIYTHIHTHTHNNNNNTTKLRTGNDHFWHRTYRNNQSHIKKVKVKVKCTLVQALWLCTGLYGP